MKYAMRRTARHTYANSGRLRYVVLSLVVLLAAVPALAHKPSDSYLQLTVQGAAIQGQWGIALRDLDYALGLDADGDGLITWGEVRARHDMLAAYALSRLAVHTENAACISRASEHLVEHHSDGTYAVLRFAVTCPAVPRVLDVRYRLLFDLDPSHRGLLHLQQHGRARTAVFSPEQPERQLDLATFTPWRDFVEFAGEGVWHIWIGFDHILFLFSLLLPAVVWRDAKQWRVVDGLRPAFLEVCKIVTSFTLAHSITLSLAVLRSVNLPSRGVESAIAASVVLAALNNVYPLIRTRLWAVAFGFGLVHGLGFASVLRDLGLPQEALLLALGGFNLGVEAGQIALVGGFLPLAFALRRSWLYRLMALQLGSWLIAAVASLWLLERLFQG
jgi:hypothetical protein